MSKPKVILHSPLSTQAVERLHEQVELIELPKATTEQYEAFLAALPTAQALVGVGLPLDRALLEEAPELRAVSVAAAGVDTYDVAALTQRGIVLTHTPDALTETVADHALAMLLSAARRVSELDARIRRGEWVKAAVPKTWFGVDFYGKTLGILGMGRIGAAVARRAALGFGMKILYTKRSPAEEVDKIYGAHRAPLQEVLQNADFVVSLLPLSEQTRGSIGARELAWMKPSAILANLGRGPVFDQAALIEVLEAGKLLGAALDVFEQEPLPTDSPLLSLPNVVLSPHAGSATMATRQRMGEHAVENLLRILRGATPQNVYNPDVLRT